MTPSPWASAPSRTSSASSSSQSPASGDRRISVQGGGNTPRGIPDTDTPVGAPQGMHPKFEGTAQNEVGRPDVGRSRRQEPDAVGCQAPDRVLDLRLRFGRARSRSRLASVPGPSRRPGGRHRPAPPGPTPWHRSRRARPSQTSLSRPSIGALERQSWTCYEGAAMIA